jgi:hypothetical protein
VRIGAVRREHDDERLRVDAHVYTDELQPDRVRVELYADADTPGGAPECIVLQRGALHRARRARPSAGALAAGDRPGALGKLISHTGGTYYDDTDSHGRPTRTRTAHANGRLRARLAVPVRRYALPARQPAAQGVAPDRADQETPARSLGLGPWPSATRSTASIW